MKSHAAALQHAWLNADMAKRPAPHPAAQSGQTRAWFQDRFPVTILTPRSPVLHSEGRGGSFCLHFGPPFGFVFWRTNCRGPGCSFNGSVGAPGWRQVGCAYGIDWGFLLLVLQYIPTCGTKELFQAPNPPPIGLQLGLRSGRALEKTKQKIAKNC